jgi:hypothetical protein
MDSYTALTIIRLPTWPGAIPAVTIGFGRYFHPAILSACNSLSPD